jgi:Nup85 Nucleoporin
MDYQGERDSPEDNGILAWDPKSPTLLIRVRGGGEGNAIVLGKEDAGTGAGCNKFESSALLRLLDARDDYLKKVATNSDSYPAIQGLCQNYCQALSECCEEWDEYLAKAGDNMEIVNVLSKSSYSPENLDLLKLMYSLTQLSGIYLVLPKRKRGFGHHSERSNMFSGYADMVKMNGAATADTVRFLRRHCLTFEEDEYGEAELRQMYAAVQPDQLDGDLYWAVVEKRMISGRLEDAWVLLSNHSSCKRVQEHENKMDLGSNDYHRSTLEVDRRGFEALKGVLLTAPIPGGRNTKEDSGYAQNSADDGSLFDELESVQGIKASAYRHWDMNASILRSGESKKFDSQQAYGLWTTWQESIRTNPDLIELCKHIPQLRKLLDLLCGDFRDIRFNSWKEELCAGLLYQTPDIKLDDMHSRAVAIMVEYNHTAVTLLDDAIIKIMKGNAGNVLDLTSLFGGQTSAALPAVMVGGNTVSRETFSSVF